MPEMKTWTANGVQFTLPFAPEGFGLGALSTPISDCNTALLSGFYKWDENCANSPFDYATMIVFGRYPGSCNQIAICNAGVNTGKVVSRTVAGTDITPWVRLDSTASAPAGYGLGTETVRRVTIAELDTLTSNGWYLVNNNKTGLTLNNEPFNWAICRVLGANDQWNVKQELYPIGVNNLKIIRAKETETTWYPWECDNPTLTPGVEYRTTERWNGRPVYTKLIDCGYLPSQTKRLVDIGHVDTTGIIHVISCQVMAEVPGIERLDLVTLPTYEDGSTFIANGSFAARTLDDGQRHHVIVLNAAYDWSMYKGYALIRYLKDY